MSFEPLLREIILETNECKSNNHLFQGLGPRKALGGNEDDDNELYDTEGYIMENYCYCFPYGQAYKGPQRMLEFVSSLEKSPLKMLCAIEMLLSDSQSDLKLQLTRYFLRAFTVLCQSFNDELDYIKYQIRGKESFGYVRAFAQHRHNSILLAKKLLQNERLFKNVILPSLQQIGLFEVTSDTNEDFKPQYFMATLLDYIWIRTVYEKQRSNIVEAYSWTVDNLLSDGKIKEFSR